jgi:phosphoglycolate phosphatase
MDNLIFDLDGTLIDSARLTGAILDGMLEKRGSQMAADRALIRRMDAVGGEAMIAAVLGAHSTNPPAELEEFRRIHRTIAVPDDLPFPGVRDTLASLDAAGIGLAICSNKPQFLCDKILGELGLAQHFRAIVGSAPDRPRKPAPDCAELALAGVGGSPANTLYCGDSAIDVATARAAGLPVALVSWGYGTAAALTQEARTPVFASMADLGQAIERHDWSAFRHG